MTDDNMTDEKRTLGEMSHTNPYTDEVFGSTQTYSRGRTVAADGGEHERSEDDPRRPGSRSDGGEHERSEDDDETLSDVDHTPPEEEVDGAQGTFDRGEENVNGPDDE